MLENARDVRLPGLGQMVLVSGIEERVAVAFEQRLVGVHAAAVHSEDGLRHEGRVHAELLRGLFHGEPVGHDVVGHGEGVGVAQVDLVLGRGHLVMDVFDRDPHRLQVDDRSLPHVGGHVEWSQVEIAAPVKKFSALGVLEIEVLELRADVEGEAELRRSLELLAQHVARIAVERTAVRVVDVAEHPGDLGFGLPGDDLERAGIGEGDHVRFLDPREPFDRGAVEPHPFGKGAFQFLRRDGERLQESEDIREPQPDELDAAFLNGPKNELCVAREGHSAGLLVGSRARVDGPRRNAVTAVLIQDPCRVRSALRKW